MVSKDQLAQQVYKVFKDPKDPKVYKDPPVHLVFLGLVA